MRIFILASLAKSIRDFRGALIEALLAAGNEVHAGAPGLFEDVETRDWLQERGVVCHDVPLARTGLNVVADLRSLFFLQGKIKRIAPDILLAYTVKPVVWGVLAAWLAGVPQRVALITGLGYAFVGEARGKRVLVRWLVSRLYSIALHRASLVFFQNRDDRDDFRRWGILPAKAKVVLVNGSGVDTDVFSSASLPFLPVRFLMIARLLRDKGVREFAEAAMILRHKYPDVEFHLVGPLDSNPESIVESEVRAWQKAGHVVWHGPLEDVRPSISSAHVYVLPSYREGTPRSVLEAMSMGRAIVTTDAPGCRETVKDGENGFLVPVRDAKALVAAMERFLVEPALISRMGARSRLISEEKYDVNKINSQMMKAMGL